MAGTPTNFKKQQIPQDKVLFFWDKVPGAVGYFLYYRPFGGTWSKVSSDPIPNSQIHVPYPHEPIPPMAVSWDPVLMRQLVLNTENTTDFYVVSWDGISESAPSQVLTYYPPELMVPVQRDNPEKKQHLMRWDPLDERWKNWDSKVSDDVAQLLLTQIRDILMGSVSVDVSILSHNSVSTVAHGVETTILTYTVPLPDSIYFDGVMATGTSDGLWAIYINSSRRIGFWTSEQDRTGSHRFPAPIKLNVGDIVDIKVIHYHPEFTADFEVTFLGHK